MKRILILLCLFIVNSQYLFSQNSNSFYYTKGIEHVFINSNTSFNGSVFSSPNTIYIIESDLIIPRGKTIITGENVVLYFNGGAIKGEGTINFNNAELQGLPRIYSKTEGTISGSVCPEWFKSKETSWDTVFNMICNLQCKVQLKSNVIYTLKKPLKTGYMCMIEGGANSTLHFDGCSTCIYVGHSNKMRDFNVTITNPQKQPIAFEISTEYLGQTVYKGPGDKLPFSFYYGSLLNIIIERININFDGDGKSWVGYGFRFFSNRLGQNGWNIKVSDCIVCGFFEYAFYIMSDDSKTKNPTLRQGWYTDLYFYNNRIARSKNGFFFGRRGTSGSLPAEKVLISGCSMQGGNGHPYFVNAESVNNLAIRDCMAWDWTENKGRAYRFAKECKAVEVWDADNMGYISDDSSVSNNKVLFHSNNKVLLKKGSSKERPAASLYDDGEMYFDTTLKKPLWKFGNKWYDANGKIY